MTGCLWKFSWTFSKSSTCQHLKKYKNAPKKAANDGYFAWDQQIGVVKFLFMHIRHISQHLSRTWKPSNPPPTSHTLWSIQLFGGGVQKGHSDGITQSMGTKRGSIRASVAEEDSPNKKSECHSITNWFHTPSKCNDSFRPFLSCSPPQLWLHCWRYLFGSSVTLWSRWIPWSWPVTTTQMYS